MSYLVSFYECYGCVLHLRSPRGREAKPPGRGEVFWEITVATGEQKLKRRTKKWSFEDPVDGPVDSPVDDFEGRSTGSARVLAFLLSGWSVDPARSVAGEAPVDDHRPAKMKIALGFLGR